MKGNKDLFLFFFSKDNEIWPSAKSNDPWGKIWIPSSQQTHHLPHYTVLQRRPSSTWREHQRLHMCFYTSSVCACRGYTRKLFPLFWTNQRIKIEMLSNIKQTHSFVETEWLLWSCHSCIAVGRKMPAIARGKGICMAYLGYDLLLCHSWHAAQNETEYLACKCKPNPDDDVVLMSVMFSVD